MNYKRVDDKIFISVDKGEYINQKLLEIAECESLTSGWISGLGAISDVEVAYYEIDEKVYVKKNYKDDYELLSLTGNVTLLNQKPFIHTHISFSDTKFNAYGGHLFDAKVIAACELLILCSPYTINRKLNCNIGLSLWDIKR